MFKTILATNIFTKSIKTKLIIFSCLILTISIGIASFLNLRSSQSALSEKIEENMIANAEAAAEGIGKEVSAMKAIVEFIAKDDKLKTGDVNSIGVRLKELKKSMSQVETLFFVDLNGKYIDSSGISGTVAEREYFKEILQKKETVVSGDPVESKASGKLVSVVITPIKGNQNQIVGYSAASMQINAITSYVLNRKFGNGGYTYAFGKSGDFFIHPDEKVALKDNILSDDKSPELVALAKTALGGKKAVSSYEFKGNTKYAGCAPVPGTSWVVGTSISKDEALAKINDIRNQAILIAVIAVVLGGALMYFIAARMINPIISLVGVAHKMADGDLTQSVKVASEDEVGQLAVAFNEMGGSLKILIQQVQKNAEQVAASSEELTASAEQSAEAISHVAMTIGDVAADAGNQAQEVESTSSVVEQMSAGIQQIATNSSKVSDASNKTANAAQDGKKAVSAAISQMGSIEKSVASSAAVVMKLGERSNEIGQIVDTISGIASQTNLLALNAAIEAARAGEQGRGFAVVAEEVRKLAEQSQDAAKKIASLIGEIQSDTGSAVTVMNNGTNEVKVGIEVVNNAGQAFEEIVVMISQMGMQIQEILEAIQQMASGSEQIVTSVRSIDQISKDIAGKTQTVSAASEEQSASMEEIATSSQALSKLAEQLQSAATKFRV
ncbi:MAG: mcpB 2 [Firmicutes bacterium]|nr:mcpB 2 [Bacillota bacterium]